MANSVDLLELIRANNAIELEAELATNPARARERTADGISLLQFAAYCRSEAAARVLRTRRPEMDIHEACRWGDVTCVARLIQTNPNDVNAAAANSFKVAPLHSACAVSHIGIVKKLLAAGTDG